jgi:hypothetical protein
MFLTILSAKYDLLIIDVNTVTEMYFIVHKTLSCELKIYHVIATYMTRVCWARYSDFRIVYFYVVSELDEFIHVQCLSSVLCWTRINQYLIML